MTRNLPEFTIIIGSFFLFSTRFYPALNSDDALAVLMTQDFSFPEAIYCWGQNRGGSLVPLLAHYLHIWSGISSIWAESITHHIILIIGYFCFRTILKSKFSKVVTAIIWFFPPFYFIGFVRYSWGILYSIFGMVIWLSNFYQENQKKTVRVAILLLISLLALASIWVLDQAIVILGVFALIQLFKKYRKTGSLKSTILSLETSLISSCALITLITILKLKSLAVTSPLDHYHSSLINGIEEFLDSIHIIALSIFNVITFNTVNFVFSIYANLSIATIVCALFLLWKTNNLKTNLKWTFLLTSISIAILLTILSSSWVFSNGVARRYFSGIYLLSWIILLLLIENGSTPKALKTLILLTVSIGSISTVYHYKYISPKRLTSKYQIVKEFESLGKVGLIAEYWNSYGSSFFNPDLIKATPHDKSTVRNWDYVDSVLAQDKIYFIRDMWLDTFPDQIVQFGVKFIKVGEEQNIGDCWINQYKKD